MRSDGRPLEDLKKAKGERRPDSHLSLTFFTMVSVNILLNTLLILATTAGNVSGQLLRRLAPSCREAGAVRTDEWFESYQGFTVHYFR